MARSKTPFPIQGRVHNFLFRVIDGQQYVQLAPNNDGQHKKRKKDPVRYEEYLRNGAEFAGAAKIACATYRNIRGQKGDPVAGRMRPYAHNRMIARLKAAGDYHKKDGASGRVYAEEYSLFDIQRAFKGLDLSHDDAPSGHVRMVPIGPQHNPEAIRILGLEQAAEAISKSGNASLEFRFRIRQTKVQELVLDPSGTWVAAEKAKGLPQPPENKIGNGNARTSAWIPSEIIPAEGFLLDLPQHPEGTKFVTVVFIEWREHKTVGRRTVYHRNKAIVQIVAVHGPAEAFIQKENPFLNGRPKHVPQQESPQIDPNEYKQDPKAYIQNALQQLRT